MSDRRLWIDTTGEPVITTTPNGVKNARRWGWTEAQAVPIDRADHAKADEARGWELAREYEDTLARIRDAGSLHEASAIALAALEGTTGREYADFIEAARPDLTEKGDDRG